MGLLPNRFTASLLTLATSLTLLALTGCGDVTENPYQKTNETDTATAQQKLTTLPSLEDTEGRVQYAVEELANYISTLEPNLHWEWTDDRNTRACSPPYDQTTGGRIHLENYVASGPIPDGVWPQAKQRAQELAATLGATGLEAFQDRPGGPHDARFYSKEGTVLWLSSAVAAVISSDTGCRLPQSVKGPTSSSVPPR